MKLAPHIHAPSEEAMKSVRWAMICAWLVIVGVTFATILSYNRDEKIRTLRLWEERLTIVANYQARQIAELVDRRSGSMKAIADNVSTRLYLSTIGTSDAAGVEAELAFLRNYVFAVAAQANLAPKEGDAGAIPANVPLEADNGLAIVHADGKPLVGTSHFPSPVAVLDELLNPAQPMVLIGPLKDAEHEHTDGRIWMAVPIYAVQADAGQDKPIGWVIGTFLALDNFDAVLAKGELPDSPATSYLVGKVNGEARILAPRAKRDLTLQSKQYEVLAAVAHQEPEKLLDGLDGQHRPAYAYAVANDTTGWSVVREVTRKAALSDTQRRANRLLISFWAAVAAVTFAVIALWRQATAHRLSHLLESVRHHERLLEMVTEHIPARLFITDDQNRYRYANREAALEAHMTREDLRGKTLIQVLGAAVAQPYIEVNKRVLQRGVTETVLQEKSNEQGLESASRIQHVPLDDLPESYAKGGQAVLVIEQDLTEVMQAKHARQQSLAKLVDTIVALADKRDPHAAYHSAGVGMIARAISETMQVDHVLIQTAGMAGELMNLGKLFIPQDLLTSQKQIASEDKQMIAKSLQMAIDHLADVPFEGPVVDTLRQAQEKFDGSGPLKLKGDAILITARILNVANCFVALTSQRAYRKRHSISEALATIQQDVGRVCDPAVVTALRHYLENLGGEARWHAFSEKHGN